MLIIIGFVLLVGGAQLLLIDGSPYYVVAGAATLSCGALVARGRRSGAVLYGVLMFATVAWAIAEVGFSGWLLLARLAAPTAVGLWFLMPWTFRRLSPVHRPSWTLLLVALIIAIGIGAAYHAIFAKERIDPMYQAGVAASAPPPLVAASAQSPAAAGDWSAWGGDSADTRFSSLDQITPTNVAKLELAWTFRFGPAPAGAPASLEVTPIKIGDAVYV